jgi:diacylglycerol O-acyltransferase / wax synthase
MAVAIMSYNGKVHFGLLADYDAMKDLERFGGHLEDCLAELLTTAKKADRKRASSNGSGKAPRKTAAQPKPAAARKTD